MVWYFHLFQNCPQFIVIHTVKGFGLVSKAGIDVFLELSSFFHDPADVGNHQSNCLLISPSISLLALLSPGLVPFVGKSSPCSSSCQCCAYFLHCTFLPAERELPLPSISSVGQGCGGGGAGKLRIDFHWTNLDHMPSLN